MKGVNVKKIAALAGVALLAGAGVAAADVLYGSTQLVDQNGQPTVKIVVGSMAQISDGVAAANIAAAIANNAYKSSTLKATVSGDATCATGAAAGTGAGTCAISNKKVTLSVYMPGSIAGAYQFKTLISDTVDRTLGNRNYTLSEDLYNSTTSSSDTGGSITSPLRGASDATPNQIKLLYRIGGSQYTAFADSNIVDPQAAATSYTEEQGFWVGTTPNTGFGASGVTYDSSASIRDVAVNKYNAMVYNMKFLGNDYGIPICTGDLPTKDTTNWASCGTDSNSRSASHRITLKFMGGDWVISEMQNPSGSDATTGNPSQTNVYAGGQVKLAKEAKHDIVNVGGVLDAGTFKVRLADISVATGSDNSHPAILDVLDANDNVIGQITVAKDTTYTFTQTGTSNSVNVHVYRTAPGFTLNAKWAEIAIYTDEITLKDNQRYNLVSSTDTNKYFRTSLLWKNKDWSVATDSNVSDSLREVAIYTIDGFDTKTAPGGVFNFPAASPSYKVTYNGVDLTTDDYEPLTFSALSSDTYRIATTAGDQACQATSSLDLSYTAKLIQIRTANQKLGGTGDSPLAGYIVDKVLFDPIGTVNGTIYLSPTSLNGTQNATALVTNYTPVVFWKVSGRDCYNWNTLTYTSSGSEATASRIKFDTAGDNSAAQGSVFFHKEDTSTIAGPATYQIDLMLAEDVGKYGSNSNYLRYTAIPVITNGTYQTFRFRATDSSTQQVFYQGLGGSTYTNYEPVLVSERGSRTESVGTSDATIKVAKKVAQPTFTFGGNDVVATAANTADYTLGEGDSQTFGGVKVTVGKIDQTVGSCTATSAGGAPACTVDSSAVKAVISPNNQAEVVATLPYKLTSSLVVTDKEAPTSGVVIAVGGPVVNTVTADMLRDSSVDFKTDSVVVKEVVPSSKIVVAGATAADTLTAAQQFIDGIRRQ
ncbi:Uncharacterised protein [Candidatus Anstonella stagnisolia]|nr:Uncharacterised protein [Candidatus Anstonella stagnisolia]